MSWLASHVSPLAASLALLPLPLGEGGGEGAVVQDGTALTCSARCGLQAAAAQRARRMRLESPVSPLALYQTEREPETRRSASRGNQ